MEESSERMLEAMIGADHEQVQILQDADLGLLAFLAIHNTSRGPAFGGIRRFHYRNPADAMQDALRLSRAMTWKCMMTGVAGGGGKVVLVDHPGLDVPGAYRRLGEYVQSMQGRYFTGPDVGTGETALAYLAESTDFVTVPGPEGPGDLAAATSRGVMAGIRAVIRFLSHDDARFPKEPVKEGLGGLHFAVQGLGEVGHKVARRLQELGARLTVAEIDPLTLEDALQELDAEVVEPGAIFDVPCDVFVPCALGGIAHDLSVGRFRCHAIAGSANNILAAPEHGEELDSRGILVAPDFVINSGALILGANFHLTGNREQYEAIDHIEDELFTLFTRARADAVAPTTLAEHIAEERLAELPRQPFFLGGKS